MKGEGLVQCRVCQSWYRDVLSVLMDFHHGLMQRSVHYVFITKPLVMNLTAIYHIRNSAAYN